ncbi:MAG: hypothetical protein COA78_02500 [Blastopirellula sp.]|nr:MAG: hypothetical protein COA78_02500 [Blastopirellula sp.]
MFLYARRLKLYDIKRPIVCEELGLVIVLNCYHWLSSLDRALNHRVWAQAIRGFSGQEFIELR